MTGSPPHGRGKEVDALGLSCRYGITPAWAGKSSHPYYITLPRGDHPRVGGEKPFSKSPLFRRSGSPPRGRGKECTGDTCKPNTRITPAWAGKSAVPVVIFSIAWDHPRVGGEKWSAVRVCRHGWGSPPRGRGKAAGIAEICILDGITPAWAGKSAQSRRAAQRSDDRKGQASQPWSPPLWMMVIRPRP